MADLLRYKPVIAISNGWKAIVTLVFILAATFVFGGSKTVQAAVGPAGPEGSAGCYVQQTGQDGNVTYQLEDNSTCSGSTQDPTTSCYLSKDGGVTYNKINCSSIDSSKVSGFKLSNTQTASSHKCGGGANAVTTSIDIGCKGVGNPITDMVFAIIRLLSDGVGIVVVASMIVGGIQFATSRDDPQAVKAATGRISTSLLALIIYIFAYAILNYVIPVGFFNLK